MCLFRTPKPKGGGFTPGVAPIQDRDTTLQEPRKLRDSDETADVSYGKGRKAQQKQAAQGARSLAINLPNAAQPGAQTGGLNTNQNP